MSSQIEEDNAALAPLIAEAVAWFALAGMVLLLALSFLPSAHANRAPDRFAARWPYVHQELVAPDPAIERAIRNVGMANNEVFTVVAINDVTTTETTGAAPLAALPPPKSPPPVVDPPKTKPTMVAHRQHRHYTRHYRRHYRTRVIVEAKQTPPAAQYLRR